MSQSSPACERQGAGMATVQVNQCLPDHHTYRAELFGTPLLLTPAQPSSAQAAPIAPQPNAGHASEAASYTNPGSSAAATSQPAASQPCNAPLDAAPQTDACSSCCTATRPQLPAGLESSHVRASRGHAVARTVFRAGQLLLAWLHALLAGMVGVVLSTLHLVVHRWQVGTAGLKGAVQSPDEARCKTQLADNRARSSAAAAAEPAGGLDVEPQQPSQGDTQAPVSTGAELRHGAGVPPPLPRYQFKMFGPGPPASVRPWLTKLSKPVAWVLSVAGFGSSDKPARIRPQARGGRRIMTTVMTPVKTFFSWSEAARQKTAQLFASSRKSWSLGALANKLGIPAPALLAADDVPLQVMPGLIMCGDLKNTLQTCVACSLAPSAAFPSRARSLSQYLSQHADRRRCEVVVHAKHPLLHVMSLIITHTG